jgi:hypothetical protein
MEGQLHCVRLAMAQALSHRPLTVEATSCSIYVIQTDNGEGFSPSTFLSSCQYHSTDAP